MESLMPQNAELLEAWNRSYQRKENHLFWPSDEVARFVARYIRRRVGINEFIDLVPGAKGCKVVDVGCGIGRNMIFGAQMGFEMHGIDLSEHAVNMAREWLTTAVSADAAQRCVQGDIRKQPWPNAFFDHAICESALDSMPFEVAQIGVAEIARITKSGGFFYCSLISGDETNRSPDFCGEVVVSDKHESDTIQSYFSYIKVKRLLEPLFEIVRCVLIRESDPVTGRYHGRWHVVSRCR
jgi:ubiquinone/menaquinone biosynthesis C-methylase UbiE